MTGNGPLTRAIWNGHTTITRVSIDEWGNTHYPPPPTPHMGHDDAADAARHLTDLHLLLGPIPDELMAFLTTLLAERDHAAVRLLAWLRTVDQVARS